MKITPNTSPEGRSMGYQQPGTNLVKPALAISIIILFLLSISPGIIYAQEATPTPAAQPSPVPTTAPLAGQPSLEDLETGKDIPFSYLGAVDTVLNGPFDTYFLRFSTPANWKLVEGASITLHLQTDIVNLGGTTLRTELGNQRYGAKLDVFFDDILITSHPLATGDEEVTFDLPLADLQESPNTGEHNIYLFLDAAIDCQIEELSTVVIKADSQVDLTHTINNPVPSLAQLPQPIFQRNSIIPETATIVTPNQPTATELSAILTTAAAFGRMTQGELVLTTIPINRLTQETAQNANLIFVGKSEALPWFESMNLPATVAQNRFVVDGMQEIDGILTLSNSPWNHARFILVVSSNSDEGVLKAAQALSGGTLLTYGGKPNVAVIAKVDTNIQSPPSPADRTFADLGYQDTITIRGPGPRSFDVTFYVPPGFIAASDSYLDITFNHSSLLTLETSVLTLSLNDRSLGGIKYSEETIAENSMRFSIPARAVLPGTNTLTISTNHIVDDYCQDWINDVFTDIMPSSLLHLPLVNNTGGLIDLLDLSNYPFPFISNPELNKLAFIVSFDSPVSVNEAAHLAANLASQSSGGIIALEAAYADQVPETMLQDNDLIIVGLPANLPILQSMRDRLPASFDPNSNSLVLSSFKINYRLTETTSMGYLQIFESPYETNSILAVLGSSNEGVIWAANALTKATPLVGAPSGNLALTNGKQVVSSDTRLGVGVQDMLATIAPQQVVTEIPDQADLSSLVPTMPANLIEEPLLGLNPKQWIPAALSMITLMILVVLAIVIRNAIRQERNKRFRINKK
jgi:cellulose synthase operon protein B